MSVKKFHQFLNEDIQTPEAQATSDNLEVVKKEIEQYKTVAPRLKQFLTLEAPKAQEEFKKVAQENSLLALEWEVLKMEHSIQQAKELIQTNTQKISEMVKERETKLKEMTDKLNQLK
jgi:DICT domain-containing protein